MPLLTDHSFRGSGLLPGCRGVLTVSQKLNSSSSELVDPEGGIEGFRCLRVGKDNFSTKAVLTKLLQLPLSMMMRIDRSCTTPLVWNSVCR